MYESNCDDPSAVNERGTITLLTWSFLGVLCASLIFVSQEVKPAFHIGFDRSGILGAMLCIAALGLCVPLLASVRHPLGFAASFYLLAVVAGYLWLSYFTPLDYNHAAARLSAFASWAAFAISATLVMKSPPRRNLLTHRQMNLLSGSLIVVAFIFAVRGYLFGFHMVGYEEGEILRDTLNPPTWMRYVVAISVTTVLPFAYAWFFTQRRYAIAIAALAVLLAYYPITLNKTTLLAPFWLLFLSALLKATSWRMAVVLSLFLPVVLGLAAKFIDPNPEDPIFRMINFRMLAIPASAIDHYNLFFSTHPLTYFCQVWIIGKIFACSLPDQLGVLLAKEFATGNYNASLLSTEGTASVGVYFAPLSAMLCGAVIAIGNMTSDRLEPALVLLSAAILLQVMMNVPLSIIMLSHGGFLMFALWFLTPRPDGPVGDSVVS